MSPNVVFDIIMYILFADAEEDLLCSEFDGSERFLVNCSLSTFCKTRTFSLKHSQCKFCLKKRTTLLFDIYFKTFASFFVIARFFFVLLDGPDSEVMITERGCADQG